MSYFCTCGPVHRPDCPLGSTGGKTGQTNGDTAIVPTPLSVGPVVPDRVAWECPRCQRVNAPHVDACPCPAAPQSNAYPDSGWTFTYEPYETVVG